jgi:hypothetical protein
VAPDQIFLSHDSVDKHQDRAITSVCSIRQADIPPIRPATAGAGMRLWPYSQAGLWKTGMHPETRTIPAIRGSARMWMESLNRFYPRDSDAYY